MEGMEKFYAELGKKCFEAYGNGSAVLHEVIKDAINKLVEKGARFKVGDRVFCFLGGNRIEIFPVEVMEVTFRDGMFQYETSCGRLAESGLYESEEEALEAMQAFINTRKG
jgi:hypothetical protein